MKASKLYDEIVEEESYDPQVPLNFNTIAGIAKKDPHSLIDPKKEPAIAKDGTVTLIDSK